jgi:hypothetical protein
MCKPPIDRASAITEFLLTRLSVSPPNAMIRPVATLTARALPGYKTAKASWHVVSRSMHATGLPKVLLLDEIKLAKAALADLKQHAQVVVSP